MPTRKRATTGPGLEAERPASVGEPPPTTFDEPETLCPVVGIGASAGGLEAFTALLSALTPDTGMAYVVVSHLNPSHPSALTEILSRSTSMPVTDITDGDVIVPNRIYVLPPGRDVTIEGT